MARRTSKPATTKPAAPARSTRRVAGEPAAADGAARTRGGWLPVGTAAERRAVHAERGNERGRRTRQAILDAAREVFGRIGYLDANVDDIVTAAGVARGSFYTYFSSKRDVFRELAREVNERVNEAVRQSLDERHLDPVAALDQANRRYIRTYREHAAIYGLIEQVATVDPVIYAGRLQGHRAAIDRVAATIRRWQARGVADPAVDPASTAMVLVSMTSNVCYWWLVLGDEQDEEQVARTVTETWRRAVDLRTRPNRRWLNESDASARGGRS